VFSSGYLAAMGAVQTLCELVDGVYSDELNHACVIDALRLTRVPRTIYAHRSLPDPTGGRSALIVTESVFGMNGEQCDIAGILQHMRPDDVLLLDEAHAIGVAGPDGRGLAGAFADERIVVIGTLSKAIGCAGGFVSGPAEFIDLLVNRARAFIFDTSLPPAIAASANAALRRIMAGEDLRALLRARVVELEDGLIALGLRTERSGSHIQPIILGAAGRAVGVAAYLRARGIFAPAIRPPTVPHGTARLRISVCANHQPQQIALLCDALSEALA
jgi:8-amino-7-oxononanoate synthase